MRLCFDSGSKLPLLILIAGQDGLSWKNGAGDAETPARRRSLGRIEIEVTLVLDPEPSCKKTFVAQNQETTKLGKFHEKRPVPEGGSSYLSAIGMPNNRNR
jgi:hypothetical protein